MRRLVVALLLTMVAPLAATSASPASAAESDTYTRAEAAAVYRTQMCRVYTANKPLVFAVWRNRDQVGYRLFTRRLPNIRRKAAPAEATYVMAREALLTQPKRWPANIRHDMGMLTNSLNRQRDDLFRIAYTSRGPRGAWREFTDWNGRQPVAEDIAARIRGNLGIGSTC